MHDSEWKRLMSLEIEYAMNNWAGDRDTMKTTEYCTGMVFFNPNAPAQWVTLPCNRQHSKVSIVCEKKTFGNYFPLTKPSQETTTSQYPQEKPTTVKGELMNTKTIHTYLRCPHGWFSIEQQCIMLYTPDTSLLTLEDAKSVCSMHGGWIMITNQTFVPQWLPHLLRLWRVLPGDAVWIHQLWGAKSSMPNKSPDDGTSNKKCSALILSNEMSVTQMPVSCDDSPVEYRFGVLCQINPIIKISDLTEAWTSCSDGSYILSQYRCDGERDCPRMEDEHSCQGKIHGSGDNLLCLQASDYNLPFSHVPLYILEFISRYFHILPDKFVCDRRLNQTKLLSFSKILDGIPDCLGGEDELQPNITTYRDNSTREISTEQNIEGGTPSSSCPERCASVSWTHSPCLPKGECPSCFSRDLVCRIPLNGNVGSVCPQNEHLINCDRYLLPCQGMFRCQSGVCLALPRVCDGVTDCTVLGEDERDCNNPAKDCTGMVRCRESALCLHPDVLCDGESDCPEGDDEMNCGTSCPRGCLCTDAIIDCSGRKRMDIPFFALVELDTQVRAVNLSHSFLGTITRGFDWTKSLMGSAKLVRLDLSYNQLREIPFLPFLGTLRELFLQGNMIMTITDHSFSMLPSLEILDVRVNPIAELTKCAFCGNLHFIPVMLLSNLSLDIISSGAFNGLEKVVYLDLSHNSLTKVGRDTFLGLSELLFLAIHGNPLETVSSDIFLLVPMLRFLRSPSHALCCAAPPAAECIHEEKSNSHSSCFLLMELLVIKIAAWAIALISIVGNSSHYCAAETVNCHPALFSCPEPQCRRLSHGYLSHYCGLS